MRETHPSQLINVELSENKYKRWQLFFYGSELLAIAVLEGLADESTATKNVSIEELFTD